MYTDFDTGTLEEVVDVLLHFGGGHSLRIGPANISSGNSTVTYTYLLLYAQVYLYKNFLFNFNTLEIATTSTYQKLCARNIKVESTHKNHENGYTIT
jgi:hypothetical protein